MSDDLILPDPARFNLTSFADILPPRDPIIGEAPSAFEDFHAAMIVSLMPATPYEAVIAENVVAIEWELLQHRRMREAGLRRFMRTAVRDAVVARRKAEHEAAMDEAYECFIVEGGDRDEWKDPTTFDADAAASAGEELADRAISRDAKVQQEALEAIAELGLEPVEVMSEAYRDWEAPLKHDNKVQELERRRRDVKRDYDLLVKTRPVEAEVIEG